MCRPPSTETVRRFVALFGPEIDSIAKSVAQAPADVPRPHPREFVKFFCGKDGRMASVLGTCVALHGAAPGELEEWLAGDEAAQAYIAETVLQLCDIERILSALGGGGEQAEAGEASGPDLQEVALCALAKAYHCSPAEVARWPFEMLLSVVAVEGQLSAQGDGEDHIPTWRATPENLRRLGINVIDEPAGSGRA